MSKEVTLSSVKEVTRESLGAVLESLGYKDLIGGKRYMCRASLTFRLHKEDFVYISPYINMTFKYEDCLLRHGIDLCLKSGGVTIHLERSWSVSEFVSEAASACQCISCEGCIYDTDDGCALYSDVAGSPDKWDEYDPPAEDEDEGDDDDEDSERPSRDITWAGRNDELYEMEKYR